MLSRFLSGVFFYEFFFIVSVQSFLLIDFVLLCILRIVGSAANCRDRHDSAMQSQIVCCGCRSVLLYPRGSMEVRCAICSTVTRAAPGTPFTFFYLSYYHIIEIWLWQKKKKSYASNLIPLRQTFSCFSFQPCVSVSSGNSN